MVFFYFYPTSSVVFRISTYCMNKHRYGKEPLLCIVPGPAKLWKKKITAIRNRISDPPYSAQPLNCPRGTTFLSRPLFASPATAQPPLCGSSPTPSYTTFRKFLGRRENCLISRCHSTRNWTAWNELPCAWVSTSFWMEWLRFSKERVWQCPRHFIRIALDSLDT